MSLISPWSLRPRPVSCPVVHLHAAVSWSSLLPQQPLHHAGQSPWMGQRVRVRGDCVRGKRGWGDRGGIVRGERWGDTMDTCQKNVTSRGTILQTDVELMDKLVCVSDTQVKVSCYITTVSNPWPKTTKKKLHIQTNMSNWAVDGFDFCRSNLN